jgi:hypothetical protein
MPGTVVMPCGFGDFDLIVVLRKKKTRELFTWNILLNSNFPNIIF